MPNHVAEAQAHHEHYRVIMQDAQAREALNADCQRPQQANIPLGCWPYWEIESVYSLEPMELECRDCYAMHFLSEKLTKSSRRNPKFGVCCLQGQIILPALPLLPPLLHQLYVGSDMILCHFCDKIRQYNMAFAFILLGVKLDKQITRSSGPYALKFMGL